MYPAYPIYPIYPVYPIHPMYPLYPLYPQHNAYCPQFTEVPFMVAKPQKCKP